MSVCVSIKPNFLVIGAMKCATTSLCDIFAQHPQMFICNPKEPDFFCYEEVFARGWKWYESLFAGAVGKSAIGEGSPNYTKGLLHPNTAERVFQHLPDAKLIYIVRHPLKRIESHWLHAIASGIETPPFPEALESWPHLVDTSLYWKQINMYRRFYAEDRILVLFFEDFVKQPEEVLTRCYKFLGVNPTLADGDPSKPSHVTTAARIDGSVIRLMRKIPGARTVKNLAPKLAQKVMAKLRKPLPERPQWTADLRRQIVRQVADDAAQFLSFYGKPPDFWRL